MSTKSRNDKDNLARLEALRPVYEDLRNQRIRSEGDVARAQQDLAEAERLAKEELGTSDLGEIRRMVDERWRGNTAKVDEFEASVNDIRGKLDAQAAAVAAAPART